jgi:hypothetical protein
MATVPGSPSSNITPMLPPWARPTPADFLQAAAIMQEKQEAAQPVGHLEEGALSRYPKPGPRKPLAPELKRLERKMEAEQERSDTDPTHSEDVPRVREPGNI